MEGGVGAAELARRQLVRKEDSYSLPAFASFLKHRPMLPLYRIRTNGSSNFPTGKTLDLTPEGVLEILLNVLKVGVSGRRGKDEQQMYISRFFLFKLERYRQLGSSLRVDECDICAQAPDESVVSFSLDAEELGMF